eukprot:Gb_28846 [translate_table: standard]
MGSCSGEEESCRDHNAALQLKLGAIAAILVGGIVGVCIPIAGKSRTYLKIESNFFFLIKAFAGGVILATGFVHVLPDAFESLTSQCLAENPWSKFPFAGFVAMIAALMTLFVDVCATMYYERSNILSKVESRNADEIHECAVTVTNNNNADYSNHSHVHSRDQLGQSENGSVLLRHRVVAQVLEIGIVAHSVIIGISLGTSESPCTIRPLVAALTFHQFFEGMGLGGSIAQSKASGAMAILFSLTTPLGIAVGIGISSRYEEDSPRALVVEGILNSASAGILIYMALVDLLANDFHSNNKMKSYSTKIKLWAFTALFMGAGCMSVLAYWA